jgi:formylglycine-generating enzyme required for sulfatase activity
MLLLLQYSKANNVAISNVSLVNKGGDSVFVQFDLRWDNSWRVLTGPANYDGVWVFFKYKTAGGNWAHLFSAPLDEAPSGIAYSRPGGAAIGVLVHRSPSNIGTGNIIATGLRLLIDPSVPYNIELRAFAVEMVFIPPPVAFAPAKYFIGDGNGTAESSLAFHKQGTLEAASIGNLTFAISATVNAFDDAEVEEPNSFFLNPNGNGLTGLPISNIDFPTGGGAAWCMKYELTQGAYRDFLNTLTLVQQTTRTANAPTSAVGTGALTVSGTARNFLEIATPSTGGLPAVYGCDASGNNIYNEATDGEFVACNFLSWPDLTAWLDWAGLQPMTEIQYEVICRGHTSAGANPAITGEFAWGNIAINTTTLAITNPFAATEAISNSSIVSGNAVYSVVTTAGPFRNGIFATATTNRVTSGASFFGVMEMSGNLSEQCVTVANVTGRSYSKSGISRGDGRISVNGNADAAYWPGNVNNLAAETVNTGAEVIFSAGTMLRGGDWGIGQTALRIADRSQGQSSAARVNYQGGRGVLVISN